MALQIMNPDSYFFNGYALPMFFVAAALALLGLFILFREQWSRIGFSFLFMCLSVGLYLFATGANYASRSADLSLLWIRISQLGSVFIPTTILLMTAFRLNLFHRHLFPIVCSFVLSTFFAFAAFFSQLYITGSIPFSWGRFVHYGPLGFVFMGFFFSVMVFVLRLYWVAYRQSATVLQKRRMRGLLIAFSGGYLGAVDFLPTVGLPVYPFGYLPICFFIVVSAYVILRYQFTDITPELAADRILETMQGAVIVSDLKGKIRVTSRVAEEMLGYQKAELRGMDIRSLIPAVEDINTTALINGKSYPSEMTWQSRSGQQFEVSVSVSTITSLLDNAPVGIVYAAYDITERKKTEETLKQKEVYQQGILNSTDDGILAVDTQGKTILANRRFAELWNIPQTIIDTGDDDTMLHFVLDQLADPDAFLSKVKELYGTSDIDRDRVLFKDGRIFERYSAPLMQQEVLIGRVWSFRDITARERMEQALRQSEGRFRSYVESSPMAILVADRQGFLVDSNDAAFDLTGFDKVALRGLHITDIHPEEEHASVRKDIATLYLEGTVDCEHHMKRRDGSLIWVSLRAVVLDSGYSLAYCQDITGRKLAEEALRKSEEENRALISALPDLIFRTGRDGVIKDYHCSDASKLYAPPELFLEKKLQDVLPAGVADAAMTKMDDVYTTGEMSSLEYPLEVRGQSSFFDDRIVRLSNGDILHVIRDITERKKAEESLRRSEESYRGLFNGVGEAIFVQDREGRFLDVNAAAERMYGYLHDYFIGKFPLDLAAHGKNDFNVLGVALEKAFAGERQRFEFWGQRANGEVFPKEVRLVHGTYQGQDVIFASADDITERKRVEDALQSSEARFRTIIENASTGILVVDVETRHLRYANPEICRMLGYSHDELMGLDITAIHPLAERNAVIEKFVGDRNMQTVCNMQTACLRKDGTVFPVEIKSAILELDGKLCHAGFFTDTSERRLLEEEQLKTQKLEAIGTLAGGIAHDFNNLLQGVFGYISLAKLARNDGEKSFTALEQAEKALHMSVRLTNQLLTFAKGGQPLKKTINLWPVIENAAKFALSGSRSGYRIIVGNNLWEAEADEGQIGQVIQNIVLNADQAMPQGGRVDISVRNIDSSVKYLPKGLRGDKYIEIAIKDSGIGIPEQYLNKIFDPYFTTKERGSGLGLATSYSIVTNHGGLIDAKSEVGKGTTFFVYLPAISTTQKVDVVKPIAAAVSVRAGTILVMDDEPVIRAVAGELLSALGQRVEFATSGEEAIEKYVKAIQADKRYDVVILDLTIRGGMGGAETVRKLKEIDENVVAVVSSGYSDDAVISNYRDRGFKAFLKKPYNVDDLRRVLNSLLGG
jgi:two-component system cell cycle sensor histidine kinase/response regulator CckA